MSHLTPAQKSLIFRLFESSPGYVLEFKSRQQFGDFMAAESGIDIYEDVAYQKASSMGKKLRLFIDKEEDPIVGKVIMALLREREKIIEQKKQFCQFELDEEFNDENAVVADDVRKLACNMQGSANLCFSNTENLELTIADSKVILSDLVEIGELLCNNQMYSENSSENQINDYFRDSFHNRAYKEVMDQTRHGISLTGKDAGEVDILIKKDGKEKALIEGLKLSSVDIKYITEHICKAITNYNALGTPTFILAYVTASNFESFWVKYLSFIRGFEFDCLKEKNISELPNPNATTRIAETVLKKDGYSFPVYFVCLNIRKKGSTVIR